MQSITVLTCPEVECGGQVFFCAEPFAGVWSCRVDGLGPQPALPVGTELIAQGKALFRVVRNASFPSAIGHAVTGFWAVAVEDVAASDSLQLETRKKGLSVAWVTLSDKGVAGLREDTSGPLIEQMMRESITLCYAEGFILADERLALKQLLTDLALRQEFDVVCTTGGTGLSPRDVTPEATEAVIEKRLRGFEQAMMSVSLAKTHNAVISRAVVGTVGNALILNLPGSHKAVAENLEAVLPAIPHTVAKLQGDTGDCGR